MTGIKKNEVLEKIKMAVLAYPMKAMADDLGKPYSTLANELDHRGTGKLGFLTALSIIERACAGTIESRAGALSALDEIEAGIGRVAFAPACSREAKMCDVLKMTAMTAKNFGEYMQVMGEAVQDGRITKKEAERCISELVRLVRVCMEAKSCLEAYR